MKQLSKTDTKALELNSTPVIMLLSQCGTSYNAQPWFDVLGWTHTGRNITNQPLKVRVATMAWLLGFERNYHVNYNERNAVWGLEWRDVRFIVYISNAGLALQLEDKSTPAEAVQIVDELHKILIV